MPAQGRGRGGGLGAAAPAFEPEPEPADHQHRFRIRSLQELEVEGRTGRRRQQGGYYGCNSAVFNVHPRGQPGERLALKVVYNVDEVETINLEEHFAADFDLFLDEGNEGTARLPPHPGILQVLSHFSDRASQHTLGPSWNVDSEFIREGSLCVLMERMDGSLKSLLSDRYAASERPPFFTPAEFFAISTQLSSAVAHLFAHGVVHRDFKPDNLLYRCRQEAGASTDPGLDVCALCFKVADFGEALDAFEFTEPTAPQSFRMPFNAPMSRGGAPHYLPPEIMSEKAGRGKFLDYTASDAWALGMVLYALLSRDEPFSVSNHREFSSATYRELRRESCSVEVASLVGALLRVDPADRLSAREANEQLLQLQTAHFRCCSLEVEQRLVEQAAVHAQESAEARANAETNEAKMKAQLEALSQQLAAQSEELLHIYMQLSLSKQMTIEYKKQLSRTQKLAADLERSEADKAAAEATAADAREECISLKTHRAEDLCNLQTQLQEAKADLQAQAANTHSERAATEKEKAELVRQLRVAEERRAAAEADIRALHSCAVQHQQQQTETEGGNDSEEFDSCSEEQKGLELERERPEEPVSIFLLNDEALRIVATFLCALDLRSLAKAARRFSLVKTPVIQFECHTESPTVCASIVAEGARVQVLRVLHTRQMDTENWLNDPDRVQRTGGSWLQLLLETEAAEPCDEGCMVCRSAGLPKHHWASTGGLANLYRRYEYFQGEDEDEWEHDDNGLVQILGPRLTIPTMCMFRFKVLLLDGRYAGQCSVCRSGELTAPVLRTGDIVRLRDSPELPTGWEEQWQDSVPRPWPLLSPQHYGIGVVVRVDPVPSVDCDDVCTQWYQDKLKYRYHVVTGAGQLVQRCCTTYDDNFTNGLGDGLPGTLIAQPPTVLPVIEGIFRSLRRGCADGSSEARLMDVALEKVDSKAALPRQAAACEKFFANLGLCFSISIDDMIWLYNLMVGAGTTLLEVPKVRTTLLEMKPDDSMCNTARGWGRLMRTTILLHDPSWATFDCQFLMHTNFCDKAGMIKQFLERNTLSKWLNMMYPALPAERKEELDTLFQDAGFSSLEMVMDTALVKNLRPMFDLPPWSSGSVEVKQMDDAMLRKLGIVDSVLRGRMLLCLGVPFLVEVMVGDDLGWEQLKSAGNHAFKLNELIIAERCYSRALEMRVPDADDFVLYSNRSACLLKRGDDCSDVDESAKIYEQALADATLCTDARPAVAKGWLRKAKALKALETSPVKRVLLGESSCGAMAKFRSLNATKKPQPEPEPERS
eukprot:COSAG03_NODE_653_length_6435_cov_8.434186_3_plen_1280_part_00